MCEASCFSWFMNVHHDDHLMRECVSLSNLLRDGLSSGDCRKINWKWKNRWWVVEPVLAS